ncbi:hypothetical protein DFH94DRAFT_630753 [Russula ochroleuca]|uniref:DDE Tnp4 domain-containing protein n=1 Tax=Russula ochroleuca TaxID=152965 RepID=A0A9P5MW12_9AGAM|nr:hypothetical protein DFH94DRAFT_630753 [Russula ochroleuca]
MCVLSRPQDYKELFNYYHAKLCNVIECIFGVFKRCFSVLGHPQEYLLDDQVCLVSALAVIHNFIRVYNLNDIAKDLDDSEGNQTPGENERQEPQDEHVRPTLADKQGHAAECRDQITCAMWRDYRP